MEMALLTYIPLFDILWRLFLERVCFFVYRIAPIAQSVEQLPFKQTVAGSNPAGRTKIEFVGLKFIPSLKNLYSLSTKISATTQGKNLQNILIFFIFFLCFARDFEED